MSHLELEQILEISKTNFPEIRNLRALCHENEDITVRYVLAMLKNEPNRADLIKESFCKRFGIPLLELNEVLSSEDNWLDYRVHTLLLAHTQAELGKEDCDFLEGIAKSTFSNYQDLQLKQAKRFPLSAVLFGMSRQFKNWARVTDVTVNRTDRVRDYIRITRKTKPEYAASLEKMLGTNLAKTCFQRDCDFTVYAFETTFQVLYGQKDLQVERLHQEGVDDISEYLIKPSHPYRSQLEKIFRDIGVGFVRVFLPWIENYFLRKEKNFADNQLFLMNDLVGERTAHLSQANAQLDRQRIALQDRQEQIVDIIARINDMKTQGERHGIYNTLQVILDPERDRVLNHIGRNMLTIYHLLEEEEDRTEFTNLVEPFGISETDLRTSASETIFKKLFGIELGRVDSPSPEVSSALEDDPFVLLSSAAGNIFADIIHFDSAYAEFLRRRNYEKTESLRTSESFRTYDPFDILLVRRAFTSLDRSLKEHLSHLIATSFEEEISFQDAFKAAFRVACEDKNVAIKLHENYHVDQILKTNRDILTNVLRDIVYDAVDHGNARNIRITTRSDVENCPHYQDLSFTLYPNLYFSVENDGNPIRYDIAEKLNDVLAGRKQLTSDVSSRDLTERKNDRAIGTRGKLNFQKLHGVQYHIEQIPPDEGYVTRWNIFIERLRL